MKELVVVVKELVVVVRDMLELLEEARLLMNRSACLTLSWSQVLLSSLVASARGMETPC